MDENQNSWVCITCGSDEMSFPEIKSHLWDMHGKDTKGLKGSKRMKMHMDGKDWYGGTDEWVFDDLVLENHYRYKRTKKTGLGLF
jgi:hypothetical protein